jgi:hypothetical protein
MDGVERQEAFRAGRIGGANTRTSILDQKDIGFIATLVFTVGFRTVGCSHHIHTVDFTRHAGFIKIVKVVLNFRWQNIGRAIVVICASIEQTWNEMDVLHVCKNKV